MTDVMIFVIMMIILLGILLIDNFILEEEEWKY